MNINNKSINFRTKTCIKSKKLNLSQKFIQIQKVLTDYEKKKFRPKIQNFHYLSTSNITKNINQKKFLLKKDTQSNDSEKVFGPLPFVFHQPVLNKKNQKSYNYSQITLASSQEKDAYTKMSNIRNPQKRRRLKQVYPKHSERYIQSINKNFMQLSGKHIEFLNLTSSREIAEQDEKILLNPQINKNITETQLNGDYLCKKYAELEIDEFLEEDTHLTTSQKRRITQYKKRDQEQREEFLMISGRKKKDRPSVFIKELKQKEQLKKQDSSYLHQKERQEEINNYSNKGWLIQSNNESNIITL